MSKKQRRFCAHYAQPLQKPWNALDKHCNSKHEGQNLGFLVLGKEPLDSMYVNFMEWLKDRKVKLAMKSDYVFKKAEDVPIDPDTHLPFRQDMEICNRNNKKYMEIVRDYLSADGFHLIISQKMRYQLSLRSAKMTARRDTTMRR